MGKTVFGQLHLQGVITGLLCTYTSYTCEEKVYVTKEFSKEGKWVLTKQCIALLLAEINKDSYLLPVQLSIFSWSINSN